MKSIGLITFLLLALAGTAQNISANIELSLKQLETDKSMQSGIVGMYVVNSKTGNVIFNRNGNIGLPAASTQKVITSTAALSILGSDFRFKTALKYDGTIENGTLKGNLIVAGYGDPTLGSWRYDKTKPSVILSNWIKTLQIAGIKKIEGDVIICSPFPFQPVPAGWAWDDIGNYYGAGSQGINWHENQYDLFLRPGKKEGDSVAIMSADPSLVDITWINMLTTGKPGSGDNSIIFLPPMGKIGYITGTVPSGVNKFTISGSFPNVGVQLANELDQSFKETSINVSGRIYSVNQLSEKVLSTSKTLSTQFSPSLDSINFWFLRKSVNLYGEAFVKFLGFEKNNDGTTEGGVRVVKKFWNEKGIDTTSINMKDGSGLSPANRITPEALVKVMQYARGQKWFSSFYDALPEINGIKMKSGSIGGTRSFTGYVNGYTFSIIVHNYNGSSGEIVRRMYEILNVLK